MGKKLNQSLVYTSDSGIYYDENYMQIMDSFIEYFKRAGSVTEKTIESRYLGQYYGDFYNMLNDAGISMKYHRIILLMNGMTNPIQYTGQFLTYHCPDFSKVDQVLGAYNTGKKHLRLDVPGE